MKKIVLIFFLIIFIFDFAFTQKTGGIKGSVKDSLSGEFIPYVSIQVEGSKLGINSNVAGIYFLKNIPIGKQNFIVSAVGYKRSIRTLEIKDGQVLQLNFTLSPNPVQLQTVTKTIDRIKEVKETNISVQSISQDELKIIPQAMIEDIFRSMKMLPGISSSGDVSSQFYVRGGNGDQNLILLDNMIIYNPFHALGLFSIFNSESIKVSEIYTGGFEPEFGGRLSSVLNIFTKDGNRNKFKAKINAGLLSGQGYLEGPIPGGAFFITYRHSYFDKMFKKFLSKDLPLSFYDFSGKVTYDIAEIGKISFNSFISKDEAKNSSLKEPDFEWNNYAFSFNISSIFEQVIFNTSFSYSDFGSSMNPKGQSGRSPLESTARNFFFKVKGDYIFKNNDMLSVGVQALDPYISFHLTNNASYEVSHNENLDEKVFWAQYRFKQINNFVCDLGVRTDIAGVGEKTIYLLEPRVNFRYIVNPDLSIKGSYTKMNQMMLTTTNENELISIFEAWIPIEDNEPLRPETADQYVLGFQYSIGNIFDLVLQGYYKKSGNLLGYNQNKKLKSDPDFSYGQGKSTGFEANLKLKFENTFAWITYNFSNTRLTMDNLTYPPRYDKMHVLNILVSTKLPYDIDLNIHWEFNSGMPFSPVVGYTDRKEYSYLPYYNLFEPGLFSPKYGEKNSRRFPDYQRLDINISRSFVWENICKINLMFDVVNIYDQKNIFYFDEITGERVNMLPLLPSLVLGVEL